MWHLSAVFLASSSTEFLFVLGTIESGHGSRKRLSKDLSVDPRDNLLVQAKKRTYLYSLKADDILPQGIVSEVDSYRDCLILADQTELFSKDLVLPREGGLRWYGMEYSTHIFL